MQIKYILAAALVAMFVIPGTASQLAVRDASSAAFMAPATSVATGGLFHDPNVEPQLSIALPTRFAALDIGSHPLQSFRS